MNKIKLLLAILTAGLIFAGCAQQSVSEGDTSVNRLTGKRISEYIDQMGEYQVDNVEGDYIYVYIAEGVLSPCQEGADGPCGFDLYVYAPKNWSVNEQDNTFYLVENAATGRKFYGPFYDDIERIIDELKAIQ